MIVCAGFRRLEAGQKVSFTRGENRGKPWAEDVKNADGTSIIFKGDQEKTEGAMTKKRKQQLKEQWRNFFDIPQYALKGYAYSTPSTQDNQDGFVLGEAVPQLGKVFILAHGCCSQSGKGNECATFAKEKLPKFISKAYEEKPDVVHALTTAFEALENEFMERAKMKSLTDGAEVSLALFVHALNAAGQPCVQLWTACVGTVAIYLCSAEGLQVRVSEPHRTAKAKQALEDAGFKVSESGSVEVAFAEVGEHRPTTAFKLPAARLIGGRPFKTSKKSPVLAKPEIKKAKEWRCVAGEELFLLMCSQEVTSMLSDVDIMTAALDAWGSNAEGLDGYEAASKAVVRTAQAQGPEKDTVACMAVQCWWQEKPLQKLLARRAERKREGAPAAAPAKAADDGFDMFS